MIVIKLIFTYLITTLVLFTSYTSLGQSWEAVYKNYTIDDGLPSNETYYSIMDNEGYLWITTDAGVARFNGFEFEVFGKKEGLEDVVVFRIYKDTKGLLWFATMSGKIFYFKDGRFYPYKWNNQLKLTLISDFEIENSILTVSSYFGLYQIKKDGTIIDYKSLDLTQINSSITNKAYLAQTGDSLTNHQIREVNDVNARKKIPIYFKSFRHSNRQIRSLALANNQILFSAGGNLFLKKGIDTIKSITCFKDRINQINRVNDKVIISFANGNSKQLTANLKCKDILKNINSITNFGEQCITTINNGIYLKRGDLEILKETALDEISCITTTPLSLLYSGRNSKRYINELDKNTQTIKTITQLQDDYPVDWIIKKNDKIFFCQKDLKSFQITTSNLNIFDVITPGTNIIKYNDSICYTSGLEHIAKINLNNPALTSLKKAIRVRDLTLKNSSAIVIASPKGLYNYNIKSEHFTLITDSLDLTAVCTTPNNIILGSKNGTIYAYENDSISARFKIPGKDYKITALLYNQNLTVVSNNGVYILNPTSFEVLKKYSQNYGLKNNNILSIATDKEYFYFGTANGIIRSKLNNPNSLKPKIKFLNNNKESLFIEHQIHTKANPIDISVTSIYGILDNLLYYSTDGTNWKNINSLRFDYSTLKEKTHQVLFKIKDHEGNYSNTITASINIYTPYYKSSFFYIFILIIFLAGLFYFVRKRISTIEKRSLEKEKTQKQISELKDQALRARLNPHFVFNSLNSIQRLYLDNKPEKASDYLVDFATLFRKILEYSEQRFNTIEEEIETLSLYLDIEKLRSDNAFDYSFLIHKEIEIEDIQIPSLLLQPIVENAIWHGVLPNSEKKKGLIEIEFFTIKETICCNVKDNGVGYFNSLEKREKLTPPKGILMTRQRLDGIGTMDIVQLKEGGTSIQIKLNINAKDDID